MVTSRLARINSLDRYHSANRSVRCAGPLRRGAAAVETAIALPVLLVLVFGSIELADGIFLKQTLAVAAYEGARMATTEEGTSEQARVRVDEVLAARGITEYTLTFTPEVTLETPPGTQVAVRIVAPPNSFSWSPLRLFTDKTLEKTVCMARL